MKRYLRKGSAEVMAIVLLVTIATISAITVGKSTSVSTINNKLAQQAITLQNK